MAGRFEKTRLNVDFILPIPDGSRAAVTASTTSYLLTSFSAVNGSEANWVLSPGSAMYGAAKTVASIFQVTSQAPGDLAGQFHHPVHITPLVVVPGVDLYLGAVHHHG